MDLAHWVEVREMALRRAINPTPEDLEIRLTPSDLPVLRPPLDQKTVGSGYWQLKPEYNLGEAKMFKWVSGVQVEAFRIDWRRRDDVILLEFEKWLVSHRPKEEFPNPPPAGVGKKLGDIKTALRWLGVLRSYKQFKTYHLMLRSEGRQFTTSGVGVSYRNDGQKAS